MAVQILLAQFAKPAGTPGVAREDFNTGVNVTATATGGPYLSQQWTIVDKPVDILAGTLSADALTAPTAASTDIAPVDLPGTRLLQVAVDSGSGLGAEAGDVATITFYAGPSLAAVADELPRREPAFRERGEHNVPDTIFPGGNPRGWAQEWERWFALMRRSGLRIVDTISKVPPPGGVRLVDIDTTSLTDGTQVWVRSVEDWFVIDKSSGASIDGITVVAPGVGPGQWLRKLTGSERWRQQAAWFIDPANVSATASDENDGFTGATALLTDAERQRRWKPDPQAIAAVAITITWLSTAVSLDPVGMHAFGPTIVLLFQGTTTSLQAGTLTGGTAALVSGTSLPVVEDTGTPVNFAAFVGKRIRLTSGANAGAIAWILHDLGANQATTSAFRQLAGIVNPAPGDGFVIEDLSGATFGDYESEFAALSFVADMQIAAASPRWSGAGLGPAFLFCGFQPDIVVMDSKARFLGCELNHTTFERSRVLLETTVTTAPGELLGSSLVDSTAIVGEECTAVDGGPLLQAIDSEVQFPNTGSGFAAASAFGAAVAGLSIGIDTTVSGALGRFGRASVDNLIWGAGNTIGIVVNSGAMVAYDPAFLPTITGATADTFVGGEARAYASLPFTNRFNGAAFVHAADKGVIPNFEVLTPAQLTANANNYDPQDAVTPVTGQWQRAEVVRLSSDAARDITGFLAVLSDLKRKLLINVGGFNITLKNLNGGSAAANQILVAGGGDYVLTPDLSTEIFYDATTGNWRTVA